jgi:nitroreductase
MSSRTPEFPVDADFIQRWSPRSLTGKAMSRAELMSLFEAARWAPSTSNTQPWRFVYGLAGSADFDAICQTLAPTNRAWAHRASALIAVISACPCMPSTPAPPG